jgi:hypothetical protein
VVAPTRAERPRDQELACGNAGSTERLRLEEKPAVAGATRASDLRHPRRGKAEGTGGRERGRGMSLLRELENSATFFG